MDKTNVVPPMEEKLNLREEFETLMQESNQGHFLNKGPNGDYTNQRTADQFRGFKMFHQRLLNTRLMQEKDSPLGRYVVGMVRPDGSLAFSHRPYRHVAKKPALDEAVRLAHKREVTFGVFRCIDVVSVQVEVTKIGDEIMTPEEQIKELLAKPEPIPPKPMDELADACLEAGLLGNVDQFVPTLLPELFPEGTTSILPGPRTASAEEMKQVIQDAVDHEAIHLEPSAEEDHY